MCFLKRISAASSLGHWIRNITLLYFSQRQLRKICLRKAIFLARVELEVSRRRIKKFNYIMVKSVLNRYYLFSICFWGLPQWVGARAPEFEISFIFSLHFEKMKNGLWNCLAVYIPLHLSLYSIAHAKNRRSRVRDQVRWMMLIYFPKSSGRTRLWRLLSL
jgi:hypothetical protein